MRLIQYWDGIRKVLAAVTDDEEAFALPDEAPGAVLQVDIGAHGWTR